MKWMRISLVILILAVVAPIWAANSLSLVDSTGRFLGTVPLIQRGDEQLMPLNTLAHRAEWVLEMTRDAYVVTYPAGSVTFRRGNPFVSVAGGFVQLRLPPQEWDGALWFPLSDLTAVFGPDVMYNPRKNLIEIRTAYLEPLAPEVAPTGLEEAAPKWTLRTVIVDPGHGGKDPGATGLGGLKEKQVSLDIALKLARMLESRGIAARLTRVDDRFVSLRERARFANDEHGDLFVSIHCNSNPDSTIRGVETYFLKPARTERAIRAAMRENSVVQLENGGSDYPELTEENFILLSMATSQYLKDSEAWAAYLLKETTQTVGTESRGVDQAGFYVLMGVSMPSVLVECGYLTNPGDAAVLDSDQGRQKVGMGIMNSILAMKNSMEMSASR